MKLIPKINAKKTLGLVGGGVAAKMVSSKALADQNDFIKHGAPILAGLLIGNKVLPGLGDGMIAVAGAALAEAKIPGLASDVMLQEDVFIQGPDFEDYSSSSYDTTSAAAGEMNY